MQLEQHPTIAMDERCQQFHADAQKPLGPHTQKEIERLKKVCLRVGAAVPAGLWCSGAEKLRVAVAVRTPHVLLAASFMQFLFKNQEYRFSEREQSWLFSAVQVSEVRSGR